MLMHLASFSLCLLTSVIPAADTILVEQLMWHQMLLSFYYINTPRYSPRYQQDEFGVYQSPGFQGELGHNGNHPKVILALHALHFLFHAHHALKNNWVLEHTPKDNKHTQSPTYIKHPNIPFLTQTRRLGYAH